MLNFVHHYFGTHYPALASWLVALMLLSVDGDQNPPGRKWQCSLWQSQTSIPRNHAAAHWGHITCTNKHHPVHKLLGHEGLRGEKGKEEEGKENGDEETIEIKLLNVQGLTEDKWIEILEETWDDSIMCLTEAHKKVDDIKIVKDVKIIQTMRGMKEREADY